MATIASLIIRIGADASTVRATLNRTARDLQQFARNASRLRTTDLFGNLPANLNRNVTAATREVNRLRQVFAQAMEDIRARSAQGLINERQFFREGQKAEEAFNKGILDARAKFARGNRSAGVDSRISAGLLSQLKGNANPARDLTQQLSVVGDLAGTLGRTLTRGLTLPVVGFGAAGVKAMGDFQASLNRAIAFIDDGRGHVNDLKNTAIQLSQVSPFGPEEIAKAMAALGQAGLKSGDVLSTLLPILRLATIENVSLDSAVETVIRSMTGLGVPFSSATAFVDKMTKASLSGTINMTELGNSFRYAATVAAQSGQSLEDILALITKLAQGGLPGETGGTSLRNIILSITDPTPKAERALAAVAKRIGQTAIATKDAKGQLLPLTVILKQFSDAALTASESAQIFGRRGGPGFSVLLQQSLPAIVALSASLKDAGGTAETVATTQFSGLNAQSTLLKNAFKSLAVAVGDSGILGFLTALVSRFRDLVVEMGKTNPQLIVTIAKWVALAAVMGPLISVIGAIIRGIALLRIALFGLTASGAIAALTPAGLVGLAIVGLGLLAKHFIDTAASSIQAQQAIDSFRSSLANMTETELGNVVSSLTSQLAQLKAARDQAQAVVSKGNPANLGVVSRDVIEQVKAYNAAKTELERLNPLIDAMEQRLTAASEAFKVQKKAADDARKSEADFQAQMEQIRALLKTTTGAAGFGLDPKQETKTLIKNIRSVTDALNIVNTQTKGLEDREQRLSGPLQDAKALWEQIQDLIDKVGAKNVDPRVLEGAQRLKTAIDNATKPDPDSFVPLIRQADNLLARIDAVKDATNNSRERTALLAPLYAELADLQDLIKAKIDEQGGFLKANINLVSKYNQLLRQQAPPNPLQKILPAQFDQLQTLSLKFEQAKQAIDAAVATRNKAALESARGTIDQLTEEARRLAGTISSLLANATSATPEEKLAAWEEFLKLLQQIGIQFDRLTEDEKKFIEKMDNIANAVSAVQDVFDSLGEALDANMDKIDKILSGAAQLSKSIGDIKNAKDEQGNFDLLKALPGIAGAISGVVSIFSGIFGGQSAQEKLLQENTQALRDLKVQLASTNITGGDQARIASAIQKLDFSNLGLSGGKFPKGAGPLDTRKVDAALNALGVSFDELQGLAKQLGINLFDEKGRLSKKAFDQLNEAIGISTASLIKFSNSLDQKLDIANLKQRLAQGGALTDQQGLTNTFDTFTQNLGPAFQRLFAGIDTTTAQGRSALRASLLRLIDQIEKGNVQLADLGNFKNVDEVLQWIDRLTGSLETLDDSVNQTAINVPDGFKLALDRFNATLPEKIDAGLPGRIDLGLGSGLAEEQAKMVDALASVQETQTTRVTDVLTEILGALQNGVATVPDSGASGVGASLDAAASSLLDAVNKLKNVSSGSEATVTDVGPAIQRMAQLFADTFGSSTSGQIRGIQEAIRRQQPMDFEAGTPTGAAVQSKGGSTVTQFNFRDVIIQGANKTAQEQWRDVKKVARDEASARFGNPNRWSEVP